MTQPHFLRKPVIDNAHYAKLIKTTRYQSQMIKHLAANVFHYTITRTDKNKNKKQAAQAITLQPDTNFKTY
ncbi:MAG: hypothetical protein A4E28_02578 [Methanocella sp. PtaU1.Bin125]|nr:MAG: hypothetical protein A4E28_02578 [Methanocella sp. PtaU1.Bin125]